MRKYKSTFLGLILFYSVLIGLFAVSRANTYSLGLSVGDTFIWEVKEYNLEPIEGTEIIAPTMGEGAEKDAKIRVKITEIEDEANYWTVYADGTDYTTEDIEAQPSQNFNFMIEKEPSETVSPFLFVALPADDYLEEIYGNMPDYEVTGNTVTMEVSYYVFSLKYELSYESTYGALEYMIFEYNEEVIVHLALISAESGGVIPGYDLFILLTISTLGAVYIVFNIKRKR